ncbi:MAG: hypothetical protein MUF10_00435 [Thermoanaerobaculaceae bacterium]|nr:hypothetical protein [Thermoanaerobaculaceae bacterium]
MTDYLAPAAGSPAAQLGGVSPPARIAVGFQMGGVTPAELKGTREHLGAEGGHQQGGPGGGFGGGPGGAPGGGSSGGFGGGPEGGGPPGGDWPPCRAGGTADTEITWVNVELLDLQAPGSPTH